MKKHILGLTLFSFIVGAAAVGYAIFNVSKFTAISPEYVPAGKTYCKMKSQSKKSDLQLIRQATLNGLSGLFVFEVGCVESPKRISLFFYKKSEEKTQLIATEEFDSESAANCEGNNSFYKNFEWAKDINQSWNIYVIARTSDRGEKFSTNFDESLAVPVLMAEGNGGFIFD